MNFKLRLNFMTAVGLVLLCASSQAANVYVLSSGYAVQDAAVVTSLNAAGHNATIGQQFPDFDGTASLAGFQAVLLQTNYNWASPDMPAAGQNLLVNYVTQGGGLVTTEWLLWDLAAAGKFSILDIVLPSVATTSYNGDASHHLVQVTPNATINSGMPTEFDIPGDNVAGSETNIPSVKAGATVFYATTNQGNFVGLSGWDYGQGRVAMFSQTVGEFHLADAFGFRLMGNVIEWVSHGAGSQQINPDTVTVRLGQITSGSVAQISDIDNQVLRVCKFIVPNQVVAPITVEVEGTSPLATPAEMQFRTYSLMSVSGVFSQTVDLYDWSISAFSTTTANTTSINTTYKPIGVSANTPVARFVNGSNRVRARYRVRQTGPASSSFWCNDLDQAVWFVR